MKLSFFVPTRNGSTKNPPATFVRLLQRLRELGDELVVVVDDTSTDDTLDVARQFTKNAHLFAHDPIFMEMRRQSIYRCTGDWIYWVDDDDILSSRWTRPALEALMKARTVTHYWIPGRYLLTEGGLYLSTAPHIGHFHMLLHRNIESIVVLPTKLHQQTAIAGEPAYLAGMYIDAMDFVWHDRKYREAKINTYDEAYDETGTGFNNTRFYLYEDYYFETRHIEDSLAPMVMAPINETNVEAGVHVRFLDCPEKMTVGQTYWIMSRIINNSDRTLLPQSEFIRWGTLAVSYHWFDNSESLEDNVDLRTAFPARISPHHQHDALVKVTAPGIPGTYQLQIDILEENQHWFSKSPGAGIYEIRTVDVTRLVWPPQLAAARKEDHG